MVFLFSVEPLTDMSDCSFVQFTPLTSRQICEFKLTLDDEDSLLNGVCG